MTFLFDVNVLIALVDSGHIHHDRAHAWFREEGNQAWATCPLTENAFIRILSQRSYPNWVASPAIAINLLREFCFHDGHEFWPDTISLLDSAVIDSAALLSHARVTDTYLLALAVSRSGFLVTLDRRLVTTAIPNGQDNVRFLVPA